MNVLIACEESQTVCKAFRELGYTAFSCDIQECSGGHPEWHIKNDVLKIINGKCDFVTVSGCEYHIEKWDLIIAHPPCTYLTVSGNRWFNEERYGEKARERKRLRKEGFDFFMEFVNANCERIAIENPIGYVSSHYRKPDQIIQPWWFGHNVSKSTCLWLKNLPPLKATNIVEPIRIHSAGKSGGYSGPSWYVTNEKGDIIPWNDPRTAKERSKTYKGIARAMAAQWGDYVSKVL